MASPETPPGFRIMILPQLGEQDLWGDSLMDLNDEGAGLGFEWVDGRQIAVIWKDGEVDALAPAPEPDPHVYPRAINNRGVVVGSTLGQDWVDRRPIVWEAGQVRCLPLPRPGNSEGAAACDVNDAGTMVGWTRESWFPGSPETRSVPVVWEAGVPRRLPLPPGAEGAEARFINESGTIIGVAPGRHGADEVIIWRPDGSMDWLPMPGDWLLRLCDLNEQHQALGIAVKPSGEWLRVLWDGEQPTILPLGSVHGYAVSINDAGTLVTGPYIGGYVEEAQWYDGTHWYPLRRLILEEDRHRVVFPTGIQINNRGQILGVGLIREGEFRIGPIMLLPVDK